MTPEVEPHPHSYPRSECVQYATGEEQKAIINSPRKNEVSGTKQKQQLSMDVSGGENKEWCYKEQHCIGTWNVKSTNQGQLDIVKQEMARVNTDILGISKNGWEWAGLIQVTIIYYHRQKSHRRNGAVLIVKKKKKCSPWEQSQTWQNHRVLFPKKTNQQLRNPSLCLKSWCWRS